MTANPSPSSGERLDGVTFEVIVSRLQTPQPGGDWILRVYAGGEHIHSAEGGVSVGVGLREAEDAVRDYLVEAGALDPSMRRRFSAVPRDTNPLPPVDELI